MDRGNPSAFSGFVRFPTTDPRYRHSGEGGLFVRLVVLPNPDNEFMVCNGGSNRFLADAALVGDDRTVLPPKPERPDARRPGVSGLFARLRRSFRRLDREAAWRAFEEEQRQRRRLVATRYFSETVTDNDFPPKQRRISGDAWAVLTLGSTGWTGYDDQEDLYWACTYDDLTEDGKRLYDLLKALYGDAGEIALQTWLDQ